MDGERKESHKSCMKAFLHQARWERSVSPNQRWTFPTIQKPRDSRLEYSSSLGIKNLKGIMLYHKNVTKYNIMIFMNSTISGRSIEALCVPIINIFIYIILYLWEETVNIHFSIIIINCNNRTRYIKIFFSLIVVITI